MTSPDGKFPDGSFGSPTSAQPIGNMQDITEQSAKDSMKSPMVNSWAGAQGGFWGIISAVSGFVTAVVGGVVGVITGIANAIGSLFSTVRVDMGKVDAARAAGENAIVANMGQSLDQLDEIQRVGGAWADWPRYWEIEWGEDNPHPIPLTTPFGLMQGAQWHAPTGALSSGWFTGGMAGNTDNNRGLLARGAGTLELQESGLWMIYFQAALLQGEQRTSTPADLWCYVTDTRYYLPVGTPPASGSMTAYDRRQGNKTTVGVDRIAAYGRAGQYLGVKDTRLGGGNTVSGYMLCSLPSPGWFVHLSATGFRHFGGAASTMVFATKVNSTSIRDSIERLKGDFAAALPGQQVGLDLTQADITSMATQADGVEVPEFELPTLPEAP